MSGSVDARVLACLLCSSTWQCTRQLLQLSPDANAATNSLTAWPTKQHGQLTIYCACYGGILWRAGCCCPGCVRIQRRPSLRCMGSARAHHCEHKAHAAQQQHCFAREPVGGCGRLQSI